MILNSDKKAINAEIEHALIECQFTATSEDNARRKLAIYAETNIDATDRAEWDALVEAAIADAKSIDAA